MAYNIQSFIYIYIYILSLFLVKKDRVKQGKPVVALRESIDKPTSFIVNR